MAKIKLCVDCKYAIMIAPSRYRRCKLSVDPEAESGLCGNMRRTDGECGPDAKLYEALRGQA